MIAPQTQALCPEKHAVSSQPTATWGTVQPSHLLQLPSHRAARAEADRTVPAQCHIRGTLLLEREDLCRSPPADPGTGVTVLPCPSLRSGKEPLAHGGEQCLAYKQHYRDSAFHGKLKGWPDSCLCMSGGDTAPLATYCNVVLLIKELH